MFAVAILIVSLSACSGASSSVPSGHAAQTAPQSRHGRSFGAASQPSDTSPCGTCSCSAVDDGSGNMVTVDDQGYPCQGGGGGPMGGASAGGGGEIVYTGPVIDETANPCETNPMNPKCALDVATQGPATQGKSCDAGGGTSAAIGSVIQGPDVHNNEVNNVYYINIGTSNRAGSLAGYGGFFLTTFGGTTWYQAPMTVPGTNSAIYLSLGNNFGLVPNGRMTTASIVNFVATALNMPANSGLSAAVKNAVTNGINALAGKGSSATVVPCFDGPWDGTPPGQA